MPMDGSTFNSKPLQNKLRFPKIGGEGYHFGGPLGKDHSIWGVYVGVPLFEETTTYLPAVIATGTVVEVGCVGI